MLAAAARCLRCRVEPRLRTRRDHRDGAGPDRGQRLRWAARMEQLRRHQPDVPAHDSHRRCDERRARRPANGAVRRRPRPQPQRAHGRRLLPLPAGAGAQHFAHPPVDGAGLRPLQFDFTTGRETRLAAGNTTAPPRCSPACGRAGWRSCASTNAAAGWRAGSPNLYVARESGRGRPQRQRTGPRGTFREPHLGSLDLSGSWLALQWSYARQGNGYSEDQARSDRWRAAPHRKEVTYHGGLVNRSLVSPTLAGGMSIGGACGGATRS